MLPVFRANKRAAQNANQEVPRVATALCAVFSSASLKLRRPTGAWLQARKQSFAQRNAPRKMRCYRLVRRKICTAILNVAKVPFSDAPLIQNQRNSDGKLEKMTQRAIQFAGFGSVTDQQQC